MALGWLSGVSREVLQIRISNNNNNNKNNSNMRVWGCLFVLTQNVGRPIVQFRTQSGKVAEPLYMWKSGLV